MPKHRVGLKRSITGRPVPEWRHRQYFERDPTFEAATKDRVNSQIQYQQTDPGRPTEWVYAVRVGNYIKIGYTTNVLSRLQTIKTHAPTDVHLIGTFAGGRRLERVLHQRFSEHRANGEWFTLHVLPDLYEMLRDDEVFHAASCL